MNSTFSAGRLREQVLGQLLAAHLRHHHVGDEHVEAAAASVAASSSASVAVDAVSTV